MSDDILESLDWRGEPVDCTVCAHRDRRLDPGTAAIPSGGKLDGHCLPLKACVQDRYAKRIQRFFEWNPDLSANHLNHPYFEVRANAARFAPIFQLPRLMSDPDETVRSVLARRLPRRLLLQLHRRGIAHNDLAKEANWLVLQDGRPALIDFQLASRGDPRSRWMRLLFREDLRHLLKHKRMYCREALTPVERRVLRRNSWVRDLWFRTGKPVYRFVTRRLLKWEDNEGQGPKP